MDLDTLRHSCSHVLAEAVKKLWPEAKLAIGPAIEDGFYYDFDKKEPFSNEDLLNIEQEMQKIIARDDPFLREELDKIKAIELFKKLNEDYKVQLIEALPEQAISIYKTGKVFLDLCRGPHIKSTGQIKAFKLLSVAGAYWHGIETNPMLQRIYGTCFETQKELDEYLKNIEEAKLRDHRKLGPQLEFFDIYHEQAGAGLVFYHPKGALLRTIIEDYEKKEHLKRGYDMVITPHIMDAALWKTSGHYDYYRENMYSFIAEDKEFVLKPMNCPGHILIYKSKTRSYKDLPIRYFELGTVYRREKAGVLHGLLRVRGFTQDDAHIFCLPEQLSGEIKGIIDFVFETMKVFGFDTVGIELSTRPEKSIGADEDWQLATEALETALKEKGLKYDVNVGDGAFYGPKIDIKLKDALKRTWQCATIQCDFALPKRFNLAYIDDTGKERQPIMLHRVLLGSLERFIGALIEHYKAELPLWLSPTQVLIIPIKETVLAYAQEVKNKLEGQNIRVDIDLHNETLNKKIRNAEINKIPYCLILGDREAAQGVVSVRKKGSQDQGAVALEEFVGNLINQIQEHK
ncbi:MAG: threonine--tRNA ligase [Candidatus Omnitrophica bacterium]|nr:threonine--tRNA ligase [Candidatus Omnitrophota bacterium]MBU4303031.1 threonine--tRNA ligase [Candidatus Omnitrophota bacterium]MBU4467264.1 threonine--tRNA ligase [Candidatus Omnitrophota bacterium]MCG2707384.1 threonine--tRNA ligase [Candidatus Omnitrophota bacterium]